MCYTDCLLSFLLLSSVVLLFCWVELPTSIQQAMRGRISELYSFSKTLTNELSKLIYNSNCK